MVLCVSMQQWPCVQRASRNSSTTASVAEEGSYARKYRARAGKAVAAGDITSAAALLSIERAAAGDRYCENG